MCFDQAVLDDCDEETAKLVKRVGDSVLRIIYEGEGLVCPTGNVIYWGSYMKGKALYVPQVT